MVRIQNVPLEKSNEHIYIALQRIYGIGPTRSGNICKKVSLEKSSRVKELDDDAVRKIQEAVSEYTTEGDLRREVSMRIKRLKDIGTYRGKRHRASLPVRGQRTRTNARTRKGRAKPKESKGSK